MWNKIKAYAELRRVRLQDFRLIIIDLSNGDTQYKLYQKIDKTWKLIQI